MKRWMFLWTVIVLTLQASPAFAPTAQADPLPLVPHEVMVKWNKVAWCESHGNWHQIHTGPQAFSGALGIKNYVWQANGGLEYGPTAGHATPEQQVIIAQRIQAHAGYAGFVPDQGGFCSSW